MDALEELTRLRCTICQWNMHHLHTIFVEMVGIGRLGRIA